MGRRLERSLLTRRRVRLDNVHHLVSRWWWCRSRWRRWQLLLTRLLTRRRWWFNGRKKQTWREDTHGSSCSFVSFWLTKNDSERKNLSNNVSWTSSLAEYNGVSDLSNSFPVCTVVCSRKRSSKWASGFYGKYSSLWSKCSSFFIRCILRDIKGNERPCSMRRFWLLLMMTLPFLLANGQRDPGCQEHWVWSRRTKSPCQQTIPSTDDSVASARRKDDVKKHC